MLYVYIGFFTFGVLYSILSLFLGGHGLHAGDGGLDGHGSHASDAPSPLNPLVLASAITVFGATGMIGKLGFGWGDLGSSLFALAAAAVIGAAIFFGVVRLMYNSQSNSMFSLEQLSGMEAEVLTPIPEDGLGEIAYVIQGMRHNQSAKSLHGEYLGREERVIVVGVQDNIALVVRKMGIEDIRFI